MAVSEQLRHQLYSKLEQLLGRDEAAALIDYFPPQGWNDVARKGDLDGTLAVLRSDLRDQGSALRAEIADLRAELHDQIGGVRGEIGGVRGEIGDLRAELHEQIGGVRAEIGDLRAELHEQIGGVRAEIGSLRAEMRTQTRSLFLSLVGLQITGAGIAVALSHSL